MVAPLGSQISAHEYVSRILGLHTTSTPFLVSRTETLCEIAANANFSATVAAGNN